MYIDYYIYIITNNRFYEKQSSTSDSSFVSEIRYIETLKRYLHDFNTAMLAVKISTYGCGIYVRNYLTPLIINH